MSRQLLILCFVIYQLISFQNANAQFTSNHTCLGGSNDDKLYPKYINTDFDNYRFKTKDGGSIYFGSSNSGDGTFAPNKGSNDLVVIKISPTGNLEFTKNMGSSFYEHNFIVTQSADSSRYFIFIESFSTDSFYRDDFTGNISIKHTLKCINEQGNEIWNRELSGDNFSNLDKRYCPNTNWETQINLYTDKQDNNITFFEKIRYDSTVNIHIIDSIYYAKTDKNGNIQWMNATTPFSIYNNSSPNHLIDTFFIYSFSISNNFAAFSGKYFLSAFLSNNRDYASVLYSLNDNNGSVSSVQVIDSFYYFKMIQAPNSLLIYGNKPVYIADSGRTYAALFYQKYDSGLNIVYEDYMPYYNDVPSPTHMISFNAAPFFNTDSSKIWFNTYVAITDVWFYYGMMIPISSKILTFGNIINQQSGNLLTKADLNKKEFTFLAGIIDGKFYYASSDTSTDSMHSSVMTAYDFNGSPILERQFDSIVFGLSSSLNAWGPYQSSHLICNIPSTFIVRSNNIADSTTGFYVFDTSINTAMTGYFDNLGDYYFYQYYNLHVIDTNTYCLINTIYQDTISGCHPNSNNIIFRKFSRMASPTALIKNKNSESNVTVYPNPNKGNFSIDFNAKGSFPISITIFDINGKIICQKSLEHRNQSLIQISDTMLPSGLYNIQISSEQNVWNNKVMITK